MEYADGGTLQDYLKKNFNKLTWNDKYNLAYQLACSILCLHDEGIVHRDLVIFLKKIFYKINLLSFNIVVYHNSILVMCWFIRIPSSWRTLAYQKGLMKHLIPN